jgi:hypothetical protein
MSQHKTLLPNTPSSEEGELQKLVDALYRDSKYADRIDALVLAEAFDFSDDLKAVVERVPPGRMNRAQFTDQINSTLTARGWGRYYGIVS